nr:MAG TPA: outer membrane protein assembly factor [Caudoviricetes sp.]
MQNLSPQWMRPLLSAASLIVLALTLSGCAGPSSVVCAEPNPLPKTLTEPSLPAAQDYSEKVSIYFQKVESWLSEAPQKQTQ